MNKYRQLCFWIAVATASTAFGQTPSTPPAATDSKVSQKSVAADGPSDVSKSPTMPNKRPAKPKASTSRPAASEAPVTFPTDATKPAAASNTAGTQGSPDMQVPSPSSHRRTASRVAIIELDDQTSKSDVIRQVVEALEKQGIARQNAPADPAAAGESGLTVRIAARSDMKVEDVMSLVRSLQGYNVQRMSFTKPINDRNVVTVLAPVDTPWPTIDNLQKMVTATKQFAVDVQIANPEQAPNSYYDGSRSRYGYSPSRTAENDSPARAAETKKQKVSETRIFMLRYADAKVMARTLSELFSEGFGIAPDEKINAIIVRGDSTQLKEVEAIVELVDGENGKRPAVEGWIPRFKTTGGEQTRSVQKQTLTVDVDVPLVPAATVRSQIADLDMKIKETAHDLRSTKSTSNQKTEDNVKRKAELREVVRKTFVARQVLQRAELAEFAARLERIQQSIEMRDRIADQIIDRRVEELLEPSLKGEHNATAGSQERVVRNQSINQQWNHGKQVEPATKQKAVTVSGQPVVINRPSDGTVILRKADEFRELLTTHAKRVAQIQASVEKWKAEREGADDPSGADKVVKANEELLAQVEADRNFSLKEYRTQIQLLESEVETVNLVVETAKQELVQTEELVKAKVASSRELNQRERELAAAQQRLDRAKALLSLYLDAAEGI